MMDNTNLNILNLLNKIQIEGVLIQILVRNLFQYREFNQIRCWLKWFRGKITYLSR
jgi:hypothetical protein